MTLCDAVIIIIVIIVVVVVIVVHLIVSFAKVAYKKSSYLICGVNKFCYSLQYLKMSTIMKLISLL